MAETKSTGGQLTAEQELQITERIKAARADERARINGIIQHAEAKARPKLAMTVALESDLSVDQAIKMLTAAPKEAVVQGSNQFAAVMAKLGNPIVGPDGSDEAPLARSSTSQLDAAKIYAAWNQPKGSTA